MGEANPVLRCIPNDPPLQGTASTQLPSTRRAPRCVQLFWTTGSGSSTQRIPACPCLACARRTAVERHQADNQGTPADNVGLDQGALLYMPLRFALRPANDTCRVRT